MAVRGWRAFAIILGGVMIAGCPMPAREERQPPRLLLASTAYDAGRVRQGEPLSATFLLRNAGDRPLVIEPPRAGCDCEASLASRIVSPGGEATLGVRCETAQSAGAFSRTVSIYANDPGRPATTLTVTAEVQPVAIADPPAVYLGHVQRGHDVAAAVKLLAPANVAGAFGAAEVSGAVVTGAVGPLPPLETPTDMRGALLRLGVRADAPLGPFSTRVRIPTGNAAVPAVTVEVGGIVDGAVVASPARLDFGRVSATAGATRVLEVRGTAERAVTLTAARMEPEVGEVESEAVRAGRAYRLTARLKGDAVRPLPVGRLAGTIIVDTAAPDAARLEVPFAARVVSP